MSYLFFIFATTEKSSAITKTLKVEKQHIFDDSSIIFIELDDDFKLYLGYFKKKNEALSVQTKILVDVNNTTFESKIKFNIPKYESIFLSYIEFSDYYHWFDIISSSEKPPECHKLEIYKALKIYIENLDKLIQINKNEIKFQLLNYFNEEYKKSNEKSLQFYLLLFKHCYEYNSKNYKKIHPLFDFNLKVKN